MPFASSETAARILMVTTVLFATKIAHMNLSSDLLRRFPGLQAGIARGPRLAYRLSPIERSHPQRLTLWYRFPAEGIKPELLSFLSDHADPRTSFATPAASGNHRTTGELE